MRLFLSWLVVAMPVIGLRAQSPQATPSVERLTLDRSLMLLGREFFGDYEKTPTALDSVRAEARQFALAIDTLAAASQFLSDPERTPVGQRRAFHGFLSTAPTARGRLHLRTLAAGEYVIARTRDAAAVPQLHAAAAAFAERARLSMPPGSPILLTTAGDGRPVFTLYVGPIRGAAPVEAVAPARTISPAMARVTSLAGSWAVTFRGRPSPKDTFSTSYTSSLITPLFSGAFLQEQVAMPLPNGRAINLVGLLGYDQFRQAYRFAWLDDTYAMFDVHEGRWQNDRLVVNNLRSGTTLLDGRSEVYSQMLWRDVAADSFVVESQMSMDRGATWFTQAEARYVKTGPACAAAGSVADTLALRALETEGARSNVTGMTSARAREFFAPEFRSWQPDGRSTSLAEIMATYRNGSSVPWASRFDITALSMHVYCDVAHVVGRADAHATNMPSTMPPLRFRWINVWRREGSLWRYVSNRYSLTGPTRPRD